MQGFVIDGICVAGGTLFDIIHKGSAKYFFSLVKRVPNDHAMCRLVKKFRSGQHHGMTLASGEFCNVKRRLAHLMTMYGF